ncbi:hypothetical protein EAG_10914 [Camponotus floridanus]|uniref:Uncharacterized protein n=1 Tax=Camponotus floridanus TaxID=104421 RepID=E2ALP8_CAMFO|nr:hypothetical protein EAG_10914 [Camponotus floridanus]
MTFTGIKRQPDYGGAGAWWMERQSDSEEKKRDVIEERGYEDAAMKTDQAFVSDSRTQGWYCRGRVAKGSRSRGWPRTTKANVYCLSRWRGLKKGNVGGLVSPIVTRMGSCVRGEFLNLVVSVLEPREGKRKELRMVSPTMIQSTTTIAIASSGSQEMSVDKAISRNVVLSIRSISACEMKKNEKTNINYAFGQRKRGFSTTNERKNHLAKKENKNRQVKRKDLIVLRQSSPKSSKSNAAWFVGVFLTNFHLLPFLARPSSPFAARSFARYTPLRPYFVKAKPVADDHSSSHLVPAEAEAVEPLSKSAIIGTLAASGLQARGILKTHARSFDWPNVIEFRRYRRIEKDAEKKTTIPRGPREIDEEMRKAEER